MAPSDALLNATQELEAADAVDAMRRAAASDRDAAAVALLDKIPGGLPSRTQISEAAVDLIVAAEVTSRQHYERRLQRPIWPKGASGLTIGIGYDVGYATVEKLESDWGGELDEASLALLRPACLVRGAAALPLVDAARGVVVEWGAAMRVFRAASIPEFVGLAERMLPNTAELHPDCLGALVSLTYNRGPAFQRPEPRFAEMRAIRAHMAARTFDRIPVELRVMKRIWAGDPDMRGVVLRREAEAVLFERGLAVPRPASPAFASESLVSEGIRSWIGGWILPIIEEPTRDRIMVRVGPPATPEDEILPDEHYVAVRVLAARIVNARKWTSAYHGAVHATCGMIYEGSGAQRLERSAVLAPDGFRDLDPGGQGKLLQVDRPLFGPMPYRGDFRLAVALFSVKSGDLAGPYLSLVSELSQTAALGALAAAQPFVAPLRLAVDTLFGTTGSASLECGTVRGFSPLLAGTWACIGATRREYPQLDGFRLSGDDMRLVDPAGELVVGAPYLVFRIERLAQREDFLQVPDLKTAWDAITAALKAGNADEAQATSKAFRRLCFAGGDLTATDAARIAARAEARVRQALGLG